MLGLYRVQSAEALAGLQWDALLPIDEPLQAAGFFHCLEAAGLTGLGSAWEPVYHLLSDDGRPLAAAASFLRWDAEGEWSMEEALTAQLEAMGVPCFPRLILATPFTPVPCAKFLGGPEYWRHVLRGLRDTAAEAGAKSLHALFIHEEEQAFLEEDGWYSLLDTGWRWFNTGYGTFEDFLAALPRSRRKEIRRERARAATLGLEFRVLEGEALTGEVMDQVVDLMTDTHRRHGAVPFLNRDFFKLLLLFFRPNIVVFGAFSGTACEAMAFCFRKGAALYGRYWGTRRPADFLYFEMTYYRLMVYAIERGLSWLDTGWGGEQKRWRGFSPVLTRSAHCYLNSPLHEHLKEWSLEMNRQALAALSEFKGGEAGPLSFTGPPEP